MDSYGGVPSSVMSKATAPGQRHGQAAHRTRGMIGGQMRPSATSLTALFLVLLGGCSATRVPTASDQQAILTALVRYEESHGAEARVAGCIRPKIEVKGQRVRAKYAKSRPTEQLVGNPIAVQLEKRQGDWVVVSEEPNWPLLRRIAVYMIGLW